MKGIPRNANRAFWVVPIASAKGWTRRELVAEAARYLPQRRPQAFDFIEGFVEKLPPRVVGNRCIPQLRYPFWRHTVTIPLSS